MCGPACGPPWPSYTAITAAWPRSCTAKFHRSSMRGRRPVAQGPTPVPSPSHLTASSRFIYEYDKVTENLCLKQNEATKGGKWLAVELKRGLLSGPALMALTSNQNSKSPTLAGWSRGARGEAVRCRTRWSRGPRAWAVGCRTHCHSCLFRMTASIFTGRGCDNLSGFR